MKQVIILGAGKHAAVVADTIQAQGKYTIQGVLAPEKQTVLDVPYLGTDDDLTPYKTCGFVVAIGDNALRKQVYEKALAAGLWPVTIIHPGAIVSRYATLGKGTVVMAGAVVQTHAQIGDNCIINTGATVDHDNKIDNHVHIAPGAHLAGSVVVRAEAFIGTSAVVLPERTIAAGATVAAGSVVHQKIPAKTTHIRPRGKYPRRVLIYAPIVGRGGIRRMVERMTAAWEKVAKPDEWSFQILGQREDEYGNPIAWPESFAVQQVDPHPAPRHPQLFDYLTTHQETFYRHLQRLASGVDLIWLPHPWWTMQVPFWGIATPVIPTIPDFAFDQLKMNGANAMRFRHEANMFARHATLAIFSSDYQQQWGRTSYGFNRTRLIHYADFVPESFCPTPDEAERVRQRYRLPENGYVLAFHCAHHKDPVTILRGQVVARERSQAVPPLVIAGIDTQDYVPGFVARNGSVMQVRHTIRELGYTIGRDLFILGEIPDSDIGGLYAGAKAAITATRSEAGISATLFEGFRAGVPMIYTDLPVFTERLGANGQYGWCFPVGKHKALGQALVEACEHPDWAAERVAQARAFVNQRSWQDVAQEYLKVFAEVLLHVQ